MKTANEYLKAARAGVRGRNFGADGASATEFGYVSQDFGAEGMAVAKAKPYVINVTYTGTTGTNAIDIFRAAAYLFGSLQNGGYTVSWSNGSMVLTTGGAPITIASGVSTITYQEILSETFTNPFTCGKYYISAAGANGQLQVIQPITVTSRAGTGKVSSDPITPVIDPYQQIATALVSDSPFRIDQNTTFTFSLVGSQGTVSLQFFPVDNVNAARLLTGQDVTKVYSDPMIEKGRQVILR